MKSKDLKEFKFDILNAYKSILHPVYKKWSSAYPSEELRLEALRVLQTHIYQQTVKALRKKSSPQKKMSEIIRILSKQNGIPAKEEEF